MTATEARWVTDSDGLRARVDLSEGSWQPGGAHTTVALPDGTRVVLPTASLVDRGDALHFPHSLAALVERHGAAPGGSIVLPVVAEQLHVDRVVREVGRVRVTRTVDERDETIDVPLLRERVAVERVPVGRVVATAPAIRQEGDTLIVPVLEEVLVVEKRLVLREELRLTIERSEARETRTVRLRAEQVAIDHVHEPKPPGPPGEETP